MPDSDTGGIVSEAELTNLTELFRRFEGATDPFSKGCKDAQWEFNEALRSIYMERVKPKFLNIDFSSFTSMTRRMCRERVSRQGAPFPCT
jgi:hypothetical protein